MNYEGLTSVFKALANSSRLKIVNVVSCDEICACDLLEYFDFTQPTLSHHMKILETAQIIHSEKRGKWHYYSISEEFKEWFLENIEDIFLDTKEDCVCNEFLDKEIVDEQSSSVKK